MPVRPTARTMQDLCLTFIGQNVDKVKWSPSASLDENLENEQNSNPFDFLRNISAEKFYTLLVLLFLKHGYFPFHSFTVA